MSYVAGGFGEAQGFKRYDPAADAWKILADIPGGRDHAMATVVAGNIHVAGGFARGEGDTQAAGWRYIAARDRWETIAELPRAAASGAATLDGFAYFADDSGTVYQFSNRIRKTRTIAGDGSAPRDHSQLVAFQGELWLIGGRNPSGETPRVSIYDPASETWRAGPSINVPRGGFAAAATDRVIVIAGGEVQNPRRALSSVEAIAAGDNGWSALTDLPIAVHGVGGAIHGNAFFALGGSKLPGGILNGGEVQIYRWGP
jgi:N-acetylneuraminic acid mutarotase